MIYPEEQFHPINIIDEDVDVNTRDYRNYHDDDSDNASYNTYAGYSASVNTDQMDANRKKQKKIIDDYKSSDKGYRKLTRYHNGKKIRVELYTTSYTPGSTIRDAITGSYIKGAVVGSINEDYFFKVKMVNGELGKDPGHLYFESPSQYESILKSELSQRTKNNWLVKYNNYCGSNEQNHPHPFDDESTVIIVK